MITHNDFYETEINDEAAFLEYAKSFGTPIRTRAGGNLIDILSASESHGTLRDSLTKRYGMEAFPIHTDCAYLKEPPKYILLRYVGGSERPSPTMVVYFNISQLNTLEKDFLTRAVWFVRGKNRGFYSSIYTNGLLRYDQEVMTLLSEQKDIMPDILSKMRQVGIRWSMNKVVTINNYSMLHYRPTLQKEELNNRTIQRISVL